VGGTGESPLRARAIALLDTSAIGPVGVVRDPG
jgi:hypothetical protein